MNEASYGDWAQELFAQLKRKDAEFEAFIAIRNGELRAEDIGNEEVQNTDPRANATLVMGSALSSVIHALRQLPAFAGGQGLTALHSLSAAFITLDNGGSPDLLKPRADVKGKKRHVDRDYVENYVLLCVELLVAFDKRRRTNARKVVASIFSKQGHRGRKVVDGLRPSLSEKSIFEWEARLAESTEIQRRAWVSARLQSYLSRDDWPPTESSLIKEIGRIAADPLLKTKI